MPFVMKGIGVSTKVALEREKHPGEFLSANSVHQTIHRRVVLCKSGQSIWSPQGYGKICIWALFGVPFLSDGRTHLRTQRFSVRPSVAVRQRLVGELGYESPLQEFYRQVHEIQPRAQLSSEFALSGMALRAHLR
jgi:hypothetical protein